MPGKGGKSSTRVEQHAALPVGVGRLDVPDSVRAAQNAPAAQMLTEEPVGFSASKGFRALRVHTQLLVVYGLGALLTFGLLMGMAAVVTSIVEANVISVSRESMTEQIVINMNLVLEETTAVLDERVRKGFNGLVLPLTFALFDTLEGTSTLDSTTSYADQSTASLKTPLSTDSRYRCVKINNDDDTQRGCNNDGYMAISTGASSVYVVGSAKDPDDPEDPLTYPAAADAIARSSQMDYYAPSAWAMLKDFLDVFVALDGTLPVYRHYPGAVGDLDESGGARTYDPTERDWYTSVVAVADIASTQAKDREASWETRYDKLTISEPYSDAFGRGYLVSLMAPVADSSGAVSGVAGTDMLLGTLSSLITSIRSRSSGEAHLFHVSSGKVVGSRRFNASSGVTATQTTQVADIGEIALPGSDESYLHELGILDDAAFTDSQADGKGGNATREAGGEEYQLVWRFLWDGEYCLLSVTRNVEIQEPIDSQLVVISTGVRAVLLTVIIICAAMLAALFPVVFLTARKLSRPLVATCKQSDVIVRNIGGDLFNGVKLSDPPKSGCAKDAPIAVRGLLFDEPGEVASLRGQFVSIVYELNKKRQAAEQPKSPFFGMGLPPSAPNPSVMGHRPHFAALRSAIQPERSASTKAAMERELAPPEHQQLNKWNLIASQIGCRLLLPQAVAVMIVLMVTSLTLWDGTREWMEPVRQAMIAEELSNLNVRAYERAEYAAAFLDGGMTILAVAHGFMTAHASSEIVISSPKVSYYSPLSTCPTADIASDGDVPTWIKCEEPSYRPYSTSALYKPEAEQPSDSPVRSDDPAVLADGTGTVAGANAWVKESLWSSQMDSVAEPLYFSAQVDFVYMGIEESESYREDPFRDLSSLVAPGWTCDADKTVSIGAFTPICREWYANAIAADGDPVFNPVAEDAGSPGTLFLSLSQKISDSGGDTVGVMAVDIDLPNLTAVLNATKLYTRGFALVWDENGMGVVHKNYAKDYNQGQGPLLIARLDAGPEDPEYQKLFQENIVDKGRVTGNWSNPWYNPELGVLEVWHYSFFPIRGTPYMMALTIVDYEVTAAADAAMEEVINTVRIGLWLSILACVALGALAFAFTWWFNKRFVGPVRRLDKLVREWGKKSFRSDIDASMLQRSTSQELGRIILNFDKLLVALRFGRSDWAKSGDKEMGNNLRALQLMEMTGSTRGFGVVMNNMGLCCSKDGALDAFPQLSAAELFAAGIRNAKERCADAPSDPSLRDTLAFRLLNCAIWHLQAKPARVLEAVVCLQEVLADNLVSPQTLAKLAFHISGHEAVSEPEGKPLLGVVVEMISRAVVTGASAPIAAEDSNFIAELAVGLCDTGCPAVPVDGKGGGPMCTPPELATWALASVPMMSPSAFARLGLHAKANADVVWTNVIDGHLTIKKAMGPVPSTEEAVARGRQIQGGGGSAGPKSAVFVLDLSYSMDSDRRLPTCKRSLQMILKEHCAAHDHIGLVSFADDVRTEFELKERGQNDGKSLADMSSRVASLRTRGMTAFYDAVKSGAEALHRASAKGDSNSKWLIALTDGADNKSKHSSIHEAIAVLGSIPDINLALITVGNDINLSVCRQFLGAVEAVGGTAMLVQASNQNDIAMAFQTVSEAMGAGVAEAL